MNSSLHIVASGGRSTKLGHAYFTQPFKIANVTEDRSQHELQLMIMSSSPGVLDNDHYDIRFQIKEGAALHVVTQGYQRLFTMKGSASQTMNIHLQDNSSFTFLPHPAVPHAGSEFKTINNIYLQKNHRLLWSEIITCGRKLSGEQFAFRKYHTITNVYSAGKLVVKENMLVEPGKINPLATGQLEGYTHQSSLFFISDNTEMEQLITSCRQILSRVEGIAYGISRLPVNGIIIRIHGHKGEQLFECNKKMEGEMKNVKGII